mmetsp:Transcript_26231/g.78329  ORF Transcript_26231/g.78329 Transcript_26231/m.78329 type:complete len:269 (-) Transcript_26231:1405-2211(-)
MEATDASRLVCVVVVSYQEYSLTVVNTTTAPATTHKAPLLPVPLYTNTILDLVPASGSAPHDTMRRWRGPRIVPDKRDRTRPAASPRTRTGLESANRRHAGVVPPSPSLGWLRRSSGRTGAAPPPALSSAWTSRPGRARRRPGRRTEGVAAASPPRRRRPPARRSSRAGGAAPPRTARAAGARRWTPCSAAACRPTAAPPDGTRRGCRGRTGRPPRRRAGSAPPPPGALRTARRSGSGPPPRAQQSGPARRSARGGPSRGPCAGWSRR